MSLQYRISRLVISGMLALLLTACASGSAIVTGTVRPATDPESVDLYRKEPQRYEVIGLVQAKCSEGFGGPQQSLKFAVAEIKRQASKLGANGVLVTATEEKDYIHSTGYSVDADHYWVFEVTVKGKAIFVHEK